MESALAPTPSVSTHRAVICLWCGFEYDKPFAGDDATDTPGCPGCGYLGWADSAQLTAQDGAILISRSLPSRIRNAVPAPASL